MSRTARRSSAAAAASAATDATTCSTSSSRRVGGALDERPARVARMVHLVDLLVREIVQRRRRDVARREREHGEDVRKPEVERPFARGAEQQEQRDHRRDAVAQHHDVEPRQLPHFGVTTFSGQIAVSTST